MFVLGLILILLPAGVLLAVLASGTDDKAVLYGPHGITLPTMVVFLAGAAALLLFIMGLELVRSGLKRANRNRKDRRRLRKLEKHDAAQRQAPASGSSAAGEPGTRGDSTPSGP